MQTCEKSSEKLLRVCFHMSQCATFSLLTWSHGCQPAQLLFPSFFPTVGCSQHVTQFWTSSFVGIKCLVIMHWDSHRAPVLSFIHLIFFLILRGKDWNINLWHQLKHVIAFLVLLKISLTVTKLYTTYRSVHGMTSLSDPCYFL